MKRLLVEGWKVDDLLVPNKCVNNKKDHREQISQVFHPKTAWGDWTDPTACSPEGQFLSQLSPALSNPRRIVTQNVSDPSWNVHCYGVSLGALNFRCLLPMV